MDNFFNGMTAIAQFILNDEWHITMFEYMRATNYSVSIFWLVINWTGVYLK